MAGLSRIQVVSLGAQRPDKVGDVADRCFSALNGLDNLKLALGTGDSPREAADNAMSLVKLSTPEDNFWVETDLNYLGRVAHLDRLEWRYCALAVLIRPARN